MTNEQREAIETCKEKIIEPLFRYSNTRLKESMKVLTKAYSELWEYLEKEHEDVLDEFLMKEE